MIDLVGPKGYVHGWKYVGGPGLPAPSGGGRFFAGGRQVSGHEFQQGMNRSAQAQGLRIPYPHAGFPIQTSPMESPGRGQIPLEQAAQYHGMDGMRGALGGGRGVVTGRYNHANGTITDRRGVAHRVISVDPSAALAGFHGGVPASHLPASTRQAIGSYQAGLKSGAVTRLLRQTYRGPGAQAGASSIQFAPSGGRMFDMAQPKLGSGARFRKLSSTLAARGASNPDALAAWIGRRKYGAKKFGQLSHHQHANSGSLLDILLGSTDFDNSSDNTMNEIRQGPGGGQGSSGAGLMHQHTYTHSHAGGAVAHAHHDGTYADGSSHAPYGQGSVSGTSVPIAPGTIMTPGAGYTHTAGMNPGQGLVMRQTGSKVRGALSNTGQRSIGLAGGPPRLKVSGPFDFIISRSDDPSVASVRHRRGGDLIGTIRKDADGWHGVLGDSDLGPHTQQRAALMELLGAHNHGIVSNGRPEPLVPYQAGPVQTTLMQQFGIPAVRTLATPASGAGQGPRVTAMAGGGMTGKSGSDDDHSMPSGLTPKGQAIYKKLCAKGFPPARSLAFAKRAQNMGGGSFKKAS